MSCIFLTVFRLEDLQKLLLPPQVSESVTEEAASALNRLKQRVGGGAPDPGEFSQRPPVSCGIKEIQSEGANSKTQSPH